MKTISNYVTTELKIKNSRFIAVLSPLNNNDELDIILDKIQKEYKKADHYCYAYIINDIKRSNDDREPTGTAGVPILNVLEKNELTNIICIVIRYFGGIKLGAGGLIRAYGKVTKEAVDKANIISFTKKQTLTIQFKYDDLKKVDSIINQDLVVKKNFKDLIEYIINVEEKDLIIIEKLKTDGIINVINKFI